MQEDLKVLREEIQNVDIELEHLFLKRMELVKKINEYKVKNSLPLEDQHVEEIKYAKIKNSPNPIIQNYYLEVLHSLIECSKKYQSELRQVVKK